MPTIALIGVDGCGKTTVAKSLVETYSRLKYLYMGPNIESSNVSLPTSRLILKLKLLQFKKKAQRLNITDPSLVSTHHPEHHPDQHGSFATFLRLFYRLSEQYYRQLVSWINQINGNSVVYDRHYFFSYAPLFFSSEPIKQRTTDSVNYWFLSNLFPNPDLVIFLDSPPEVIQARKKEKSIVRMQAARYAYMKQAEKVSRFIVIDASKPLEIVVSEVKLNVEQYVGINHRKQGVV